MQRVRALPVNEPVPQFWLGAGGDFRQDVIAARAFQRRLMARQPDVMVHLAPGGKHNMATWRALIPPLLECMTPRLAYAHPASGTGDGTCRRAVGAPVRGQAPRSFRGA